jgi:hypothetical protein
MGMKSGKVLKRVGDLQLEIECIKRRNCDENQRN